MKHSDFNVRDHICIYTIAFKSLLGKIYCCVNAVNNGKSQSYLNCIICYLETHCPQVPFIYLSKLTCPNHFKRNYRLKGHWVYLHSKSTLPSLCYFVILMFITPQMTLINWGELFKWLSILTNRVLSPHYINSRHYI